jgi:endonuclease-8
MPEGHTIHRIALDHTRLLVGRPVAVSSPQGRFASDAARVDGAVLERIEAYGKHLFHYWSTGDVGHVHLGLFGKFRVHRTADPPPPGAAVRMRLRAEQVAIDLTGPTACEIGTPDDRDRIVARLGPDPLRHDADPVRAVDTMRRSTRAVGALLLDQSVISGIGNVFRAEALFVARMHPQRPGAACTTDELVDLWSTVKRMLRAGVRANRIVTVSRPELGLPRSARIPRADATYVYQRDRCLVCGTHIATLQVANRLCYYCPVDQAR